MAGRALGALYSTNLHPVKVSITAGYLLGSGTLEKGGHGLSRPGGNLGFRVSGLGFIEISFDRNVLTETF